MAFSSSGLNAAVNGLVAAGTFISFHTADPGTTGASEVSGSGYARQSSTFGAATNGVRVGSQVSTTIPAATSITHWGLQSAATAGTFLYGGTLPSAESFGQAGTYAFTPTLSATN